MAAMTNSDLDARIQHVNERINRLMDIVTRMEGKLQDVSGALKGLQQSTGGYAAQAFPVSEPRQLPLLSGPTANPIVNNLGALVPLIQSFMQGTQPDPQTLLQGLTALMNLRQAPMTMAQQSAAYEVPINSSRANTEDGANSMVIFLILILLIFGMRAQSY